ncbi:MULTISPECIES: polysaccharide lyase [Marinomonas]|uniref:Polysaccharide lyase n=1 Tax=Marinomonas rhodophyticola TaxID=2992803 RepID=A0ABT3KJJ1_9GAMM|nr:polysaccharide lyase [Marinomonas sp. KJ51-3]MCW4630717.1 polysaccharide lyase [Marinomonas sp. KJ51-3]
MTRYWVLLLSALFSFCVQADAVQNTMDHGDFGPFMRSLNNTSYGYQVIEDVTRTAIINSAPTKLIEKFEVHPGDCYWNKGWNDCEQDRERSELSEQKKTTPAGSDAWYGWSIYFPEDFPNVYPTKTALGQFHQANSHPIWMFQNGRGGYHLDDHISGTKKNYELINEADLRGRWHKIEVHARWEKDDSGVFQVWVNGEQKVDYQGPTMDADIVYFKYGVYRSFLSRYKQARQLNAVPPQIVYYSNVKRGKNRASLQP